MNRALSVANLTALDHPAAFKTACGAAATAGFLLTLSKSIHILSTMKDVIETLRQCGIQPTPQRIAVVEYVLMSRTHPSADDVLSYAREKCPTISRATVYNTLNLLVEKGLLVMQTIKEGAVIFDRNVERHHHFIDEDTGEIHDIPWDQLEVNGKDRLSNFEITEFQVIMRGRKKK